MKPFHDLCPPEDGGDYLAYLQTRDSFRCVFIEMLHDPAFWALFLLRSAIGMMIVLAVMALA